MRAVLLLILLSLSFYASATDFYVKNGGNDLSDGLSDATAWATIEKVNASFVNFKPGDRILFRSGDTFFGSLKVSKSGSAGSPITIGAYGTGPSPVLTGFKTLDSWIEEGNGIYSSAIISSVQTNMAVIDGVQAIMGRYPDSGTNLIFESHVGLNSITDNELGSYIDWTGAEAVINTNDWSLDRCKILDHSGNVLTYTNLGSGDEPQNNRYYFIQNHLRTLTVNNEWYHDLPSGKFYIYGNPQSKSVSVATIDNIILNNGFDYITIDGLSLRGAVLYGVCMTAGSLYCTISNCKIEFIGESGIRCDGGSYHTYDNNIINHVNRGGIYINASGYFTITNNSVSNAGVIPGGSFRGSQNDGMYLYGLSNSNVQYNSISYTGYNGIYITGNNTGIKNNLINYSCMVLNDGGGIYTSGSAFLGRVFSNNIILNSGVGNANANLAEGIYLDTESAHVTVTGNTTANCLFAGIKNHRAFDNTFSDNTSFNNRAGIFLHNSTTTANTINNVRLNNNISIARSPDQRALIFYSRADDIPGFGTADNNYYARPVDDDDVFGITTPTLNANYTLAGWQAISKQDLNSRKSYVTVTDTADIDFYYNPSKSDKTISLVKPMVDVTGRKYSGSVTLIPYTSVILFPDPNPAVPAKPVYSGSVIENATPTLLYITFSLNLANITPSASAFTVKVNGTVRNINVVSVSGNKIILTLATPVVYDDIVTVLYTKPSVNPVQTTEGVQAESFSDQSVLNKCLNAGNKPPVVSISSPSKGSIYFFPSIVTIDVQASDSDGSVTKVELFNGNVKLAETSTEPYSFVIKDLAVGSYSIYAVATDNLKSVTTSSFIDLTIKAYEEASEIFNLYPNPNNGQFTIRFAGTTGNEKYIVKIFNLIGTTVFKEEIPGYEEERQFDLSGLNSGTYILMIFGSEILFTQKFIIV